MKNTPKPEANGNDAPARAPRLDSAFVRASLRRTLVRTDGPRRAFTRAVIDSRLVEPGDFFVALPGEHLDGHDFAADAVARGAAGVLLTHDVAGTETAARFFVADPLASLQRLAAAWRRALPDLQVVGVTGNVGKSTTKLIVAAVLAKRYHVQVHAANYNNEIGVPLCLLELRPETERAVIELGMYTTGEIAQLCEWTQPRVGIVLNVGPVHLERAGSLEAIVRAKRELPEALPPHGHAILNADDPDVRAMRDYTRARVWLFGAGSDAYVRGSSLESHGAAGFTFTLSHGATTRRVRVPLPGKHLLPNALAAAAAGLADDVPFRDVVGALESLDVPTRLQARTLPNGVTLFDDTYNASPAATLGALDLLAETSGRRLALLGDMRELGALAGEEHARIGARAAKVVAALYTVGDLGALIAEAARAAGHTKVTHYESKEAATEALLTELRAGDVLLIKASRALALETVVAALSAQASPAAEHAGR